MEAREDRSISTGTTSNPAAFITPAAACACSSDRSPTTTVFPYPTLRAIAMPIWPAPVQSRTSLIKHLLFFLYKAVQNCYADISIQVKLNFKSREIFSVFEE